MDTTTPFKWRHFQAKIILLCVRWYLRYSLSYRDLEEMMLERGLHVDHTTIYRWVQQYAPRAPVKKCCVRETNEVQAQDRPFSGRVEAGIQRR
jgi:IS6 family transposase